MLPSAVRCDSTMVLNGAKKNRGAWSLMTNQVLSPREAVPSKSVLIQQPQ